MFSVDVEAVRPKPIGRKMDQTPTAIPQSRQGLPKQLRDFVAAGWAGETGQ